MGKICGVLYKITDAPIRDFADYPVSQNFNNQSNINVALQCSAKYLQVQVLILYSLKRT